MRPGRSIWADTRASPDPGSGRIPARPLTSAGRVPCRPAASATAAISRTGTNSRRALSRSAWRWLRGDRSGGVDKGLRAGLAMAAVLIPLQILAGDLHGLNTKEHQPAKVAAMEGIWETERGAGLRLFARALSSCHTRPQALAGGSISGSPCGDRMTSPRWSRRMEMRDRSGRRWRDMTWRMMDRARRRMWSGTTSPASRITTSSRRNQAPKRLTTWSMCFASGSRVDPCTMSRNSLDLFDTQPCSWPTT